MPQYIFYLTLILNLILKGKFEKMYKQFDFKFSTRIYLKEISDYHVNCYIVYCFLFLFLFECEFAHIQKCLV